MLNLAEKNWGPGVQIPRRAEVLILDDSEFDRKRMCRALTRLQLGVNVTEVETLQDLGSRLAAKEFDVILVDYALTDGDGLQALVTIKSSSLNDDATVVMVTGNDSSALAVNALKLGFDDYITKDEMNSGVLAKMFSARSIAPPPTNVIPFPIGTPEDTIKFGFPADTRPTSAELAELFEPVLKSAIDSLLLRMGVYETSDNIGSFVASFYDEDELIFISAHDAAQ